jgi:hypothetical protein
MKPLPIPVLSEQQRFHIGGLAQQLTTTAQKRYRVRKDMTRRIKSDLATGLSKITKRLDE